MPQVRTTLNRVLAASKALFWVVGAALVALVFSLVFTRAVLPNELSDPGAFVRWGLPVSRMVFDLSGSLTIAGLFFATCLAPWGSLVAQRCLRIASISSVLWTISAMFVMVLTYANAAGIAVRSDTAYTQALVEFVTRFELGQAWFGVCILTVIVSTLIVVVESHTATGLVCALAGIVLVPVALTGHSAGGDDHMGAVNSMGLHIAGASLWVGGVLILALIAPLLMRQKDRPTLERIVTRYSYVALVASLLVIASGVVNASLRITEFSQLSSLWGTVVIFKALLTVVIVFLGWLHRSKTIPRLHAAPKDFVRLILVEIVILGLVSGLAVGLARTAPPRPEELPPAASPARILTGYELPPELTGIRYITEWRFDWLWIAIAVLLLIWYVRSFVRMRRRGDHWPVLRLVSWVFGLVALTYFTSGAPAVYGMVLFSAHMLDHMALTMFVPMFLVLGAPMTLALRVLPSRHDGSRGVREWLLLAVHSRYSRIVTNPLFAAANFAGSIILFYYSDAFGWALKFHIGHELMNLHFLLAGYIFVLSMIGIDPLPRRAPYPLRLLVLFATMAFHAFFGVTLMGSNTLIQAWWFGNMGRPWGLSAIEDQKLGGAITWGVGELPTLVVALGVMAMWSRSDSRERRRKDRAAERDDDAELKAYNEMLSARAEASKRFKR